MEPLRHLIESLRPYHGAVLAFVVALAVGLVGRWMRRPPPPGLAAGVGALAGWVFTFGLPTASPRQLPERLPLLLLALVALTPVLGRVARRWRWLGLPLAVLCAIGVGWWMSGAPLILPDLRRAALPLAGIAAAALLLALLAREAWAAPVATSVLLLGFMGAALRGPHMLLGGALFAAALGASLVLPGRSGSGPNAALANLPVAGTLAALAALPVIARGSGPDWAAGLSPLLALAVGAPIGASVSRRLGAPLGALLAGVASALLAFFMR